MMFTNNVQQSVNK